MVTRTERSERETNQDINAAIAGTEDEIFRDVMEGDPDDNDGDHDLEDMGEGLEGEHLEDEDAEEEAEEGDEDAEEDESGPSEEDGDEDEVQAGEQEQTRDERGRFERDEPRIPPGRLRAEADRARQAEQREQEWQRRHEVLEARFNDMQARINTPPPQRADPQAPPPKPDMFAEPEKYEQWVLDRADERAAQRMQAVFNQRDEAQRQQFNDNVERSMAAAERGPRGFEFRAAYNALLQLNNTNPQDRSTVQSIVYSRDPAGALFEWWDANGGEAFRETLIAQLQGRNNRDQGDRRGTQARREREDRSTDRYEERPRHVVRPARPMRSLNGAAGGSSHRVSNPEMLDGSEGSVFEFATRR
jgi:hypothetical protein